MLLEPVSPELRKIEKDWEAKSITFRQLKIRLDALGWVPVVRHKVVGWKRVRFPEY